MLLLAIAGPVTAAADDDLLAELANRAGENENVAGSFTQQKNIQGLPLALESAGSFNYSKREGVIWHTTSPLDSVLNISAAGLRYDNGEPVQGSSILAEMLLGVFTGDLSQLTQYFTIEVSGKPLAWRIVLAPQSATVAEQVKQITMTGAHFTQRITIIEASGDTTEISLQVQQDNDAEP
ncbi:MAG: LolA family protein [Pseudomonadales bacterium]